MPRRCASPLPAALLVLASVSAGCRRETAQGGGPLPPPSLPPGGALQESIQNRFGELSSGVFTRTVYRTAAEAAPKVEVRDLEIAPGKTLAQLALPGAAVLEVRSGQASARVGTATRQLQTGAVLALSEGEALGLDNRGDVPLSVRLYVIGAK